MTQRIDSWLTPVSSSWRRASSPVLPAPITTYLKCSLRPTLWDYWWNRKVSLNKSFNSHLAQGFEILERPLIGTMLTPSCLVWYWMNNFDEHEQWWNSPQLWSLVWWWKEPSSPSLLRRPSFSSQSPDERISTLVRDSRKKIHVNICIWLAENETTMPTGVQLFPPSALDKPTTFTFFVEKPREKYLWTPASLCQPVWATQPCHCPCNRTTGATSACRWPGRYKM